LILFCDECTGPLVDAPDGDYRDPYGTGPGVLRGIYKCDRPGCSRHFHPSRISGYFSLGGPANFVQEPCCSKGHVAAVISVNPDPDQRKYGCVACNVEVAERRSVDAANRHRRGEPASFRAVSPGEKTRGKTRDRYTQITITRFPRVFLPYLHPFISLISMPAPRHSSLACDVSFSVDGIRFLWSRLSLASGVKRLRAIFEPI
jgi:hypothetical protein